MDRKKHKNLTEREQDIRQYILEHPEKIEETKKELSYSQLVKIGRMIADASCVDFYVKVSA